MKITFYWYYYKEYFELDVIDKPDWMTIEKDDVYVCAIVGGGCVAVRKATKAERAKFGVKYMVGHPEQKPTEYENKYGGYGDDCPYCGRYIHPDDRIGCRCRCEY